MAGAAECGLRDAVSCAPAGLQIPATGLRFSPVFLLEQTGHGHVTMCIGAPKLYAFLHGHQRLFAGIVGFLGHHNIGDILLCPEAHGIHKLRQSPA
jgi:hypothetical protein